VEKMHSLLKRQLRRYFNDSLEVPEEWQGFLDMVNSAYYEFDTDRNMLERSLELSSQELLQANTEMRVIFEAIPDLFFRLDYDGTILDCKTSTDSDLYISKKELIGNKIYKIPIISAAKRFEDAIEELKRTMALVSIEYSLTIQGKEYFYEARLVPALDNEIIAVVRNVTERKVAENALRESEQKYRNVVEGSHVGVYIVQDGLFRFVNNTFCEIHGYSYEEIVDTMSPVDFVVPEDLEFLQQNMKKRYTGEARMSEITYNIRHKNGEIRTIKVISTATLYKGNLAIMGTLLDVSKVKALEEQLLQSQKLETIGRLTGGIAHDFNNMLGVILGNTQLAMMNLSPDDVATRFCSEVEKATHRAAEFTHQLLAFSRRQVLEMKTTDLNDILANFERMVQHIIGEYIEMKINCKAGLPMIKADSAQINQILLNLMVNAREAMPNGGKLTIETDALYIDEKQAPLFPDISRGRYALVSVTDTGIGMDKEMLTKMYEPFFTTKAHGTGLGLSVVYGIVKQHDGFIDVYSQPGKGTTFKIYFPSAEKADAVVQKEQSFVMTGNETILIIEDDDEFRKVESAILEKLGYTVCVASGSIEGLEIFKAKNGAISLVILDLIMPKLNGWEILSEMRKIKPAIPSLFVTGYGLDSAYMKYIPEKGIDILQKPFSFDALSQKVREIIDRNKQ
jgi:two-component system, cell cycle sensor histidine kinase and response regulator CckA